MLAGVILKANEVFATIRHLRCSYIESQAILPGQQLSIPVPFNLNRLTPLNDDIELMGGANVDRVGFQAAHQDRRLDYCQRNRLALLYTQTVNDQHVVISCLF